MKRNPLALTALMVIALNALFSSCQKKGIDTVTPPTGVTLSPCRLADQEKTSFSGYEHYWYTYTAEGKVDSIYYSQYAPSGHSAPVAFCKINTGTYLWKTYQNVTANVPPETFLYEYSGVTQDSSQMPMALETNFTLFDGITTPSGGYHFDYNSERQLNGYIQHNAIPLTGLEYAMGAEYNKNGDIKSIVWNVITGPRLTSSVISTGYDGHPTPWAGSIATYVFVSPSVKWFDSEYDPLFFGLSAHNPTGSVYTNGPDKQWEETYSYQYNDRGQPVSRKTVRNTTEGGVITSDETYTYNCD